jgi:haloacetate dehalogenase
MSGGPIREMEYSRLAVRGADYLVGTCGTGTAVLLLHGFPQTHYCWRHVVPTLSQRHRVVVTDLRGYGATTAPPGGPEGQGFSKREMALDLVQLMDALECRRFAVVGHDRGARVAYRMALDHPERVERLVVLNIVPTLDQFERMSGGPSLGYWPWFLLAQLHSAGRSNVPLGSTVLARVMGYRDATTTERTYIHLFDRQRADEQVREAMQSAMAS